MKITDEVVETQTIKLELTQEEAWTLWVGTMYLDNRSGWKLVNGNYTRTPTKEAGWFFGDISRNIENIMKTPKPAPEVFING